MGSILIYIYSILYYILYIRPLIPTTILLRNLVFTDYLINNNFIVIEWLLRRL